MPDFTLGWSHSRYNIFKQCKRKYYLHYYKNFVPSEDKKEVLEQRNLISYKMLIGTLVHDFIEVLLKKKFPKQSYDIVASKLETYVNKMVQSAVNAGKFYENFYLNFNRSNEEISSQVIEIINVFVKSDFYKWLVEQVKTKQTNPNDWIVEPGNFGETNFNGLKAYCKMDFLMPTKDKTYIFDWKTGAVKNEHEGQIIAYALTAKEEYGFDPVNIITSIVYINEEEVNEKKYDPPVDEINGFIDIVNSQTKDMYDMCTDVGRNYPKPMKKFVKTEDRSSCKFCNFKRYCKREN